MRRVSLLSNDTIVAPATATTPAGVAIVRLSGPHSATVLHQIFVPRIPMTAFQPRLLYHGHVRATDGSLVDEVLAVSMHAPHSYTGEDVVEIHCHGSALVVRQLLDLCVDEGCRLARPGEFTQRAFLNGRIDLSRAEAVIDLIQSRSAGSMRIALQQLDGQLQRLVQHFRESLLDTLSLLEAAIDFPEDEIEILDRQQLSACGERVRGEIESLLKGFDNGRVLREGASILILGRPNAGKSSLLNALLGEARAIVSAVPGTTRDTIEEQLVLGDISLRLIDTAGMRHTDDPIEAEGVARARARIATADLVLLVTDASTALSPDDQLAIAACAEKRVLAVRSKADLGSEPVPTALHHWPVLVVSTHTGLGLEPLRQAIIEVFLGAAGTEAGETFLLSDRRHREALVRVSEACGAFLVALHADSPPELLAVELHDALAALGEITGETTPDEVLERIFARFCIGK